jgi:hypothetical protein
MADILRFVRNMCERYNLRAIYVPHVNSATGMQNDFFSFTTKQGHVVMNFTTRVFYDIPPTLREKQFVLAMKRGLNSLLGERSIRKNQQTIIRHKFGRQIV